MAYTNAEKHGWKRPAPRITEVKSRFGFTSDFCLSDKGYKIMEVFPFFALYRKGSKMLIQWRGKEWRRQRDEDFVRLHGMTFEESQRPENAHLFVARTCLIQKEMSA